MTLIGDAIHAMTPYRGIGANIALKDAVGLRDARFSPPAAAATQAHSVTISAEPAAPAARPVPMGRPLEHG